MEYIIIDVKTKKQVGKVYKSLIRASLKSDKLDSHYGAYRYTVHAINRSNEHE